MHLTDQRWRAWLSDALPTEDARAVGAHLAVGCERCEAVIEAMPPETDDIILGMTDDLWGHPEPVAPEVVDEAFESVMARVRGGGSLPGPRHKAPWYDTLPLPHRTGEHVHGRPARRRRTAWAAVLGVVAAAALVVVLVPTGPVSDPYDGIKGTVHEADPDAAPELSMSYAVARSGKVIRPGRDGDAVPADADLLFRFRVRGGPAYVFLVREYAGARELVWPDRETSARTVSGAIDLAIDGVVQGVSLQGLSGDVKFVAVAVPSRELFDQRPLSPVSAPGVAITELVVRVQPSSQ